MGFDTINGSYINYMKFIILCNAEANFCNLTIINQSLFTNT